MDFFAELEKKQSKTGFQSSPEMRFYLDHAGILSSYPMFAYLADANKPFDVIRANIVIRSIINKQILEDAYEKALRLYYRKHGIITERVEIFFDQEELAIIEEARSDLPYFQEGDSRIYIPILPRACNKIYEGNMSKLSMGPFHALLGNVDAMVVDPFDTYGDHLYRSSFTPLIAISTEPDSSAFYDYDSCSIFIVNSQGRLETSIAIFDKYLKRKSINHMLSRLRPAVDAYYHKSREEFQEALVDNQLISSRFLYKNRYDEMRLLAKFDKRFAK